MSSRSLTKPHAENTLSDQLAFFAKPKLLVIDELGYLPLERASAHVFFQLVTRRYERGSILRRHHHPPNDGKRQEPVPKKTRCA